MNKIIIVAMALLMVTGCKCISASTYYDAMSGEYVRISDDYQGGLIIQSYNLNDGSYSTQRQAIDYTSGYDESNNYYRYSDYQIVR